MGGDQTALQGDYISVKEEQIYQTVPKQKMLQHSSNAPTNGPFSGVLNLDISVVALGKNASEEIFAPAAGASW